MESELDWHSARALLEWQVELGATEAISETPINRFEIPAAQPPAAAPAAPKQPVAAPTPIAMPEVDAVAEAALAAKGASDLEALKAAMAAFEHCDLKRGARNLVFSDGVAGAPVMIIGEAPGRDEDREGRPFVGRAGQLLDKMFAAIGQGRDRDGDSATYITNVMPWRPPQNRDPKPEEIAMMKPFLERHIALAKPKLLVVMGNISAQAVLGQRGITRLRGNWSTAWDLPVMPMFHPAYLLRNPLAKREAWADLQAIQAHLSGPS